MTTHSTPPRRRFYQDPVLFERALGLLLWVGLGAVLLTR